MRIGAKELSCKKLNGQTRASADMETVADNAMGYHTDIRMNKNQVPVIVNGGLPGSFLGEYQTGGIIIVLGLNAKDAPVFHFFGTGMHGGKTLLRVDEMPQDLPWQMIARRATEEEIRPYADGFSSYFGVDGVFEKSSKCSRPIQKIRTNSSIRMYSL